MDLKERLRWQHQTLDKVCGQMLPSQSSHTFRHLRKDIRVEIENKTKRQQIDSLSIDVTCLPSFIPVWSHADMLQPDTEGGLARHYEIQRAFTGSQAQTGPMVEPSRAVLQMMKSSSHGLTLPKFRCLTLPTCRVEFLDTQITGAVFMLQRTFGSIPLPSDSTDEVHKAAGSLTGPRTHGGIITDTMGLGKTFLALLFVNYCAVHGTPLVNKPTLILAPNGVVLGQWLDAIYQFFPDLAIILVHSEKPTDAKFANCWVPVHAMRQSPQDLRSWPKHLTYIFDVDDRNAARAVVLSTYDTFASRTVATTTVRGRKIFKSRWQDKIGAAIFDEGHRLRHRTTRAYAAVRELNADSHWFLTATPVVNSSHVSCRAPYQYGWTTHSFEQDILGPLRLLWTNAKNTISSDPQAKKWSERRIGSFDVFDDLDGLPNNDIRKLIAMDPRRKVSTVLRMVSNTLTFSQNRAALGNQGGLNNIQVLSSYGRLDLDSPVNGVGPRPQ